MTITTFSTLKFVRRLEKAGVTSNQAEVQAEVLTEAFNVNLESLVTKYILAARFAEQNASINTKFAEQQAYMDTRFADQKADFESKFRVLSFMVGIVMVAVVLPYLERILSN